MSRRWQPGWNATVQSLPLRVVEGHKAVMEPGEIDLRLEWFTDGRWRPVPMSAGALMADFFAENEEIRYPQSMGYKGGRYYLSYLRTAATHGWRVAESTLQAERQNLFDAERGQAS